MPPPIPRDIPNLPPIRRPHHLLPSPLRAATLPPLAYRPLTAALRLLLAGTAAAGVALVLLSGRPLHALSHFSVQSNILLTLVTLASAHRAWSARKPVSPALTGAALLYVTTAALAYHLLPTDAAPADHLLHTVTPTAALLDWLLLTPPGGLRLRHAATWTLYPAAYLAFSLTRPDPFPALEAHGYKPTLTNTLLLTLAFYALATLLVALDHTRPRPIRPRAKTGFRLQPPVG